MQSTDDLFLYGPLKEEPNTNCKLRLQAECGGMERRRHSIPVPQWGLYHGDAEGGHSQSRLPAPKVAAHHGRGIPIRVAALHPPPQV